MATFTVTTAADTTNAGDGVLSLREAVQQANASADADTIVFANALEGQTLTLTQGQLTLSSNINFDGDRNDDGAEVILSGGDESRVLSITGSGTQVEASNLTITNGNAGADAGGGVLLGDEASLNMMECTVRNSSAYYGGGIWAGVAAGLNLDRCFIANNGAGTNYYQDGGHGGGILLSGGRTKITGSTITDNSAIIGGGILNAGDSLIIRDSTIANNDAFTNQDISGSGSAIFGGIASLYGCTITGNQAETNFNNYYGSAIVANIRVSNSIISGNFDTEIYVRDQDNVHGEILFSNGHNIFGTVVTGAIAGDLESVSASSLFASIDSDTGGGVLALNGGPTPTVALRNALDNPALSGADPVTAGDLDQRGFARANPAASLPDIGAFELTQSALSTTATAGNDVLTGTAGNDSRSGQGGVDLLLGLGGNDTLNGDGGNDTLRGGLGNDALLGGAGLDTASYRDATAAVTVSLASNTSSGALGADTLSGIEHLEGGSGGDGLTGDGLGNSLGGRLGNDLLYGLTGNDRLYGGAGDDLLEGGFGDDWLDGGEGVDTVSYFNDTYPLAVTIDLFTQTVTRSGETDRLREVENADGTNNADTITGNVAVNRLGGAGGDDVIRGLGGDDLLNGGLGNDVLDGDAGLDLADYGQGAAVTVNLSGTTDTATRGTEVDTLREIEGAIGSGSNDTLIGDALANVFRAQGGKDTLTGGAGADLFDLDVAAHSAVGANRDVITDFTPGSDDLDLATIDAKSATAGVNDAFTFLAAKGAAFTGAGQVRWYQSGGVTLVEANVDANLAPDLQIQLTGLKTLTLGDFIL